MAIITFPLSLPSTQTPTRLVIRPEVSVGSAVNKFTFQRHVQTHQGQRWTIEIDYPPMYSDADAANEMEAFLTALQGRKGTFTAGPVAPNRGAGTGTPLVKGGSQTGDELVTDGWTQNITGILKANDFFQIGSGASARLYKVLKDVNSNGSGEATIPIFPRLRTTPADNTPLVVVNPVGAWRLTGNVPDVDSDFMFHTIAIRAEEDL